MNSALLLIPFFLIRFGLLSFLSPSAIKRAAHFAPFNPSETPAYWVYQLSNVAILVALFFLKIQLAPLPLFCAGVLLYGLGSAALTGSVLSFATPADNGLNKTGVYRFSRNPMYVAYFLFFIACVLLTQSVLLLGFVCAFQVSAHWVILAEERWCAQTFGSEYLAYKATVRRYI